MSFGVGLGDIALILQTCIAIYKKFKEADETIVNAHDRIQTIHSYVNTVIGGLDNKFKSRDAYPKSEECLLIVKKMNSKGTEVKRIFRKYKETQQQPNFVSAGWCQLLYTCGSSTHELQTLVTGLERHRDDLAHQFVALMLINTYQPESQLVVQPTISPPQITEPDVNILFLDADNIGRSVVAQAYASLVAEWTQRTKGQWKINAIHAAGIDVRNQCGLIEIRQHFPAKLIEGKELPSLSAQSALFDKPTLHYAWKAGVQESISKSVSRGLGKSTFSNYDYIFVFTLNHLWAIQKLLLETKKKLPHLVAKGKSKFVVLGEYGNSKSSEIWGPEKYQTPQQKKEYWDRTVANIKVSFRGWLTEEMNWKQPSHNAPQS